MHSVELLTLFTTFILIILAELGDKTQVAVLLFTGNNPAKRWTVLLASALALILCVSIEVTFGVVLAKYIGPQIINRIAGAVFLLIGFFTLGQIYVNSVQDQFQAESAITVDTFDSCEEGEISGQ